VWAAVLYAGPEACASYQTALWLAGALDRRPARIHISIPNSRRVRAPAGVTIHVSRHFAQRRHPAAQPPRTRLEDAVLDVADD
jgi:predicted transcriptional regulator of viral defense system